MLAMIAGCGGKQAGIEGKVVDGKGQPMAGVKVIAKQVQPIKGYEQFETTTGSDGAFKFKGLFPTSEYAIFPWSDKWKTSARVTVQSGPEGQTSMVTAPMTIRFTVSNDGIIADNNNHGLEWAPAPDQTMSWFQARNYAQGLSLGGGGWRLPTREELKSIYDKSREGGADPAFRVSGKWVWSGEGRDASTAWRFTFRYGDEGWSYRYSPYYRVLVVRPKK